MSKKRREEEAKILKEMEEAMKEDAIQKEETPPSNGQAKKRMIFGIFEDKTPSNVHCNKCKTLMENGVCPHCGQRMYVPMDAEKQKKIRWTLTGICVVAFFLILIVLEIVKS